MTRDDETLRRGFEWLSREAAFTEACPTADRLWAGARGELSPADVEPIAIHMAECGACAEAWRIARDFGEPAVLAAPARGFPWWMGVAAAAVVAVGMSLVYLTQTSRRVEAPAQVAAPAPVPPPTYAVQVEKAPLRVSSRYALTWRGPNDGQQFLEALKLALAPYERGDYAVAATELARLTTIYPETSEPQFYLGVSRLLSGDAAGAVAPLERARVLGEPDQREDAQWYLAAVYERTGRLDDARREAQAVCDGKGARSPAACAITSAIGRRP